MTLSIENYEVGEAEQVKDLLHYGTSGAVSVAACRGRFKRGIYLGSGKYNVGLIKHYLKNQGTPFITKWEKKSNAPTK